MEFEKFPGVAKNPRNSLSKREFLAYKELYNKLHKAHSRCYAYDKQYLSIKEHMHSLKSEIKSMGYTVDMLVLSTDVA